MTQKHILAKAVKDELSKFVGQKKDDYVRECIRQDLFNLFYRFAENTGFSALPPDVNTSFSPSITWQDKNQLVVTLTDPKTGEIISVEERVTRAEGGFYG